MMCKDNLEKHYLELDGESYRITLDPATGDWHVDTVGFLPCQNDFKTKEGAIDYCLEKAGLIDDGDYQFAPDRTSA